MLPRTNRVKKVTSFWLSHCGEFLPFCPNQIALRLENAVSGPPAKLLPQDFSEKKKKCGDLGYLCCSSERLGEFP